MVPHVRDRFIVRRLEDQGTTQQPAPSPVEGARPEPVEGARPEPVEGLPPIPISKRPKGRDPGGSIRMRSLANLFFDQIC